MILESERSDINRYDIFILRQSNEANEKGFADRSSSMNEPIVDLI